MARVMRAGGLTTQDQDHFKFNSYCEIVDEDVEFADLFEPRFWVHVRARLRSRDIVRVIHQLGHFDVFITVIGLPAGGVMMRYLYGDPGTNISDPVAVSQKSRGAAAAKTTVPLGRDGEPVVRIQFLPRTKWRLLGIDGHEVSRGIETKPEAEAAMERYLLSVNMVMPASKQKAEPEKTPEPEKTTEPEKQPA